MSIDKEPHRELRITLRQHDGQLVGRCWCGRTRASAHPDELWDWLDEHRHAPPAATER